VQVRALSPRWRWVVALVAITTGLALLFTAPAARDLPRVSALWDQKQPVSSFAWDGRSLWVTLDGEPVICQTDPRTGAVSRRIPFVTGDTAGSAWDGRWLWQIAYKDRTIHKIDLQSGRSVGTLPTPGVGLCCGMTFDGQYLWVANFDDARIYQIDPAQGGKVLRAVRGLFESTGLAWDGRRLWHGILVGTKVHDEPTPYFGFIEERDPLSDVTGRVVALPGVGPGTAEWLPGRGVARRFWWYDGYHKRVVRVELPGAFDWTRVVAPLALVLLGALLALGRGGTG
jgi:hypothetical protein